MVHSDSDAQSTAHLAWCAFEPHTKRPSKTDIILWLILMTLQKCGRFYRYGSAKLVNDSKYKFFNWANMCVQHALFQNNFFKYFSTKRKFLPLFRSKVSTVWQIHPPMLQFAKFSFNLLKNTAIKFRWWRFIDVTRHRAPTPSLCHFRQSVQPCDMQCFLERFRSKRIQQPSLFSLAITAHRTECSCEGVLQIVWELGASLIVKELYNWFNTITLNE